MEWDGMRNGMGWDGTRWDRIGWDEMGLGGIWWGVERMRREKIGIKGGARIVAFAEFASSLIGPVGGDDVEG